jgi:hypothetical protein
MHVCGHADFAQYSSEDTIHLDYEMIMPARIAQCNYPETTEIIHIECVKKRDWRIVMNTKYQGQKNQDI